MGYLQIRMMVSVQDSECGRCFRMFCQERRHRARILLSRGRVWRRCQQEIVKGLGGVYQEHWDIDHGGAPLFPIRLFELNCQAAHRLRRVSGIGVAARKGKSSHDRDAAYDKD
jgi:hypothetical protein